MKIRIGFVSNSSSSSFVVIERRTQNIEYPTPDEKGTYVIGKEGVTRFGWGPERIYGVDSKINWAWLQSKQESTGVFTKSLERILLDIEGIKKVECHITDKYGDKDIGSKTWGYIDHQSLGYKNHDMFLAPEVLKDFLFNPQSFIMLDNDNH